MGTLTLVAWQSTPCSLLSSAGRRHHTDTHIKQICTHTNTLSTTSAMYTKCPVCPVLRISLRGPQQTQLHCLGTVHVYVLWNLPTSCPLIRFKHACPHPSFTRHHITYPISPAYYHRLSWEARGNGEPGTFAFSPLLARRGRAQEASRAAFDSCSPQGSTMMVLW
ncbi:hypothetical protein F5Y08DRAFT_255574 [Xylaria arbuscula]|nr:hypothetical protein F5Y08DRAFT_255574 [Xylaria arbuscula]